MEHRARLLADIRSFMDQRKLLEVETPVLGRAANSDPNIHGISTDGPRKRFLRTSPEYALKRLVASGYGDIYELGRVFRGGEKGRTHNPEFTMLEWYRVGMPYLDLAAETVELIGYCGRGEFDDWKVRKVSYRDLFREQTGVDPFNCNETELSNCAAERGLVSAPLSQQEWFDLILAGIIQPALPGECFTIVHDFPPEQAALARIRPGNPDIAERFEVYLGQMELANGYQELTDADEQLRRFERERRHRKIQGEETGPVDTRLIDALRHGLRECSGVALGVDRLLMSIMKLENIDAILAFGADRC
jgi:lysyl-tRNA synthetase class 2